jgi:hypothetical protein
MYAHVNKWIKKNKNKQIVLYQRSNFLHGIPLSIIYYPWGFRGSLALADVHLKIHKLNKWLLDDHSGRDHFEWDLEKSTHTQEKIFVMLEKPRMPRQNIRWMN